VGGAHAESRARAGHYQGADSWAVPASMARRHGCSESCPLTYATYESHVKNYIEPGIGALRLDRLRVADVQPWLNRLATQCQCCAQGRTPVGRSTGRHGAVRSGSAVIGSRPRGPSRTLGPSCVQRCTRQYVKN